MQPLPDAAISPPADPARAEALRQTARDVRLRLLFRITALHVVGGLLTFTYLQQRYPASQAFATPWLNDYALVVATEAALAPLAWAWTLREFRRTAGWALAGRDPSTAERDRLLAVPFRLALRPFALWLAGAANVSSINGARRVFGIEQTLDIAQILVFGGLGTCAIGYLVVERTFRPLVARALTVGAPSEPRSLGIRARLLLAWAAGSGVPLFGLVLSPFRDTATGPVAIGLLSGVGIVAGLFTTSLAADSIAAPMGKVRKGLKQVGEGDLSVDLLVDDGGEVGQVQAGFNQMVLGLRERQELQDLFGRHVGHEVAAQAIERGTDLGGESRRASVVFVDLIGSTAMAEVLPPGEVVATLNAFFHAVVDTVTAEGGWVNKFEGDGALCIFGVPGFQPDHEARALRAARRLRVRLAGLAAEHPGLDAGVGVSAGIVVAGNVGSEERFEYTVIGRAVNEAARLTDLAKQRPGRVVASASAVRAAGAEQEHWVDRGRVGLRGQQIPTEIFEPAPARTLTPQQA